MISRKSFFLVRSDYNLRFMILSGNFNLDRWPIDETKTKFSSYIRQDKKKTELSYLMLHLWPIASKLKRCFTSHSHNQTKFLESKYQDITCRHKSANKKILLVLTYHLWTTRTLVLSTYMYVHLTWTSTDTSRLYVVLWGIFVFFVSHICWFFVAGCVFVFLCW